MRKWIIAAVVFLAAIVLIWAAAADLEPDSNVSQGWNDNVGNTGFDEIFEGADTHDGDTTHIAEASNNVVSEFGFDATPGDFGTLNSMTIKVAHGRWLTPGDDNQVFNLAVFDNVPTQIGTTKTCTPSDEAYTVESFTDAAWDSMTQTQVDGMTVNVTHKINQVGMPDPVETRISAITVELDYNVSAARSRVVDIQ